MANEGKDTSEFSLAKSSNAAFYVSMILAAVVAYGPQVLGIVDEGSAAQVWLGLAIAVAGAIQKALIQIGYIKSRTDIKNVQAAAGKLPELDS